MDRPDGLWRTRWAAVGAALAVAALGGGIVHLAEAAPGSGNPSALTAITPCRLFDTRPAPYNVGLRSTPLTVNDTFTAQVTGTNGRCTIPASATGVSMNVTIANPTAGSFLTVFPADAPLPDSSSLNWTASSTPTPNAVTVLLSASGAASFYNLAGSVDVIADVVGYYTDVAASTKTRVASANRANADITLSTSSNADFLALSPQGTGPVTLSSPGQLVANVALTIGNHGASGTVSRIDCSMFASPGNIALGTHQIVEITGGTRDFHTSMALTGAAAVNAGTYNVDVICIDLFSTGASAPFVNQGSLTVMAVPN